ncbi:alpha/beta hydrolase [Burkholderia singularis]|uniref:Lipolytic enzyme n=1 Tax=Burkholderia singularis TaxID=1503053 RepID=A0A238HAJ6_9BURK|nr:alpha/beta hydrolase [Burkholderia singularis]SMG02200.1 Lipolytic enzyme [Burkholderia singularis]
MLEPEIEAFIARAAAWYPGDASSRPIIEQRALYDRFAAAFTRPLPIGVTVSDARFIAADGRAIRLRRYRSHCRVARGTVLYFHGGGFVVGSLDSHAPIAARIAADTGLDVIVVDYRLAPEHRAPAAVDDCLCIAGAALGGYLPFDSTSGPFRLVGDSAGGTLAAWVAASLRDAGRDGICAIALVYPMLGFEPQLPARETEAHASMLTLADVRAYLRLYWGDVPPPHGAMPLDAHRLDGLPPVLAIGAEHDPLRDDAYAYVCRIRSAGADASYWLGRGLVHGAWRALDTSPQAARMHQIVCDFLVRAKRF